MPGQHKPKIDKVEKLAAELAVVAVARGAWETTPAEKLATYCLDVAKRIANGNEQDAQG